MNIWIFNGLKILMKKTRSTNSLFNTLFSNHMHSENNIRIMFSEQINKTCR